MYKKVWLISTTAATMLLALAMTGTAFAQAVVPPPPLPGGPLPGGTAPSDVIPNTSVPNVPAVTYPTAPATVYVSPNADGTYRYYSSNVKYSQIYNYLIKYLALELGMKRSAVRARLNAGDSMKEIIESQGYSAAQATQIMNTVYEDAIAAARSSGVLTRRQVNLLLNNREYLRRYGVYFGSQLPNYFKYIPGQ